MDSPQPFEAVTVAEVGDWLSGKGFSVEVQDAFKGKHCEIVSSQIVVCTEMTPHFAGLKFVVT